MPEFTFILYIQLYKHAVFFLNLTTGREKEKEKCLNRDRLRLYTRENEQQGNEAFYHGHETTVWK